MPPKLVIISVVLLLGAWFLINDKSSFQDKMLLLAAAILVYIGFRWISGATLQDIFIPIVEFFKTLKAP